MSSGGEGTGVEQDRQRAKRPATVLAGPYGHPFHPILVTVPIGAWVASFVFDLASRWAERPDVLATGSRWLLAVGVLGAVAAATVGMLDLAVVPAGTVARRTGYLHGGLNLAVTTAYGVSFALRDGSAPVGWGLLGLSTVALAALGVSGWLGGKLTYRYGVRVADEGTQLEGFSRRR